MNIHWQNPEWLWLQGVPLIVLALWILAELRRRRHIQVLGDPELLGISTRWFPGALSVLALAGSLAAVGAIVPLPSLQRQAEPRQERILILLDPRIESAAPASLDTVEAVMRRALEFLPEASVSLYRGSVEEQSGPDLRIPDTLDRGGFWLLWDRVRFWWTPSPGTALASDAAALAETARQRHPEGWRVLVLSPHFELSDLPEPDRASILFVELSLQPGQVASPEKGIMWISAGNDDQLREFLTPAEPRAAPSGRWSFLQLLAALGLVLLPLESALRLHTRARAI